MSTIPFMLTHKHHRNIFNPITHKDLIHFRLNLLNLLFFQIFINHDKISSYRFSKSLSPVSLQNLSSMRGKNFLQLTLKPEIENFFKSAWKLLFQKDSPCWTFFSFFHLNNPCIIKPLNLFFDHRKCPSNLSFQSSHRNSLPPKNQILDNICSRLAPKEFCKIHHYEINEG